MRIVLAPDAFKGSLSAVELCEVMEEAIHEVAPTIQVTRLPLADGGEGTLNCLVMATGGEKQLVFVQDPLGRLMTAYYGVLGDGQTVVIELAQASGLTLLKEEERNPLVTSTYGTGQLIQAAIEAGYRKFIVGLGGSATNDAGVGLLRALGLTCYDANREVIQDGGAALLDVHTIDEESMNPLLKKCTFVLASDVENMLCGVHGASFIFGPQKGADAQMVRQLDDALAHYAKVVQQQYHVDLTALVGGGAAGGVGASLQFFLNASYRSGIDVVMELIGAREVIKQADIVMTGEGRLDEQTLAGKVITGITGFANEQQIPVIAFAGAVELTSRQLQELGVTAAFSIVPGPCSLQEALNKTPQWLKERVIQVIHLYRQAKGE